MQMIFKKSYKLKKYIKRIFYNLLTFVLILIVFANLPIGSQSSLAPYQIIAKEFLGLILSSVKSLFLSNTLKQIISDISSNLKSVESIEFLSLHTILLLIGVVIGATVVLLYFYVRTKFRRRRGRRKSSVTPGWIFSKGYKTAKVQNVLDGDTVIVTTGGQEITIRLAAIDCPENGQHWGDTAKYGLIKLIGGGRIIRFEEHDIDKYGRVVATVYVQPHGTREWMNVNARMVTLGHAWVYRLFYDRIPKQKRNELDRLEKWAKFNRVGLWQTPNPLPPWNWRKS